MPREFYRKQKVADLIQRELARLIQQRVKDPRVGMITINEATVSRDMAYADVYFTVFPDDDRAAVTLVLDQASGYLRSQLAKILKTRTTPRLRFHYDTTIETGAKMSQAIDEALAEDRHRAAAAGATDDSSLDDSSLGHHGMTMTPSGTPWRTMTPTMTPTRRRQAASGTTFIGQRRSHRAQKQGA